MLTKMVDVFQEVFGHSSFFTTQLFSTLLNSLAFSHNDTVVTILDSRIFSYHFCRLKDKRHQDKCSQPEMHLGGLVTTGKRIGVGKGIRILLHSTKTLCNANVKDKL